MTSLDTKKNAMVDDFSDAYDEYKDAIFRHCYFHTFNREEAKDLLQETFIKTWQYVLSGKKVDNMRAFLYKVATNLIINASVKKKAVSLEAMQEAGFDPGEEDRDIGRDWIQEERVMKSLASIDEPYRSAVTMRYVEGLLPAEIAEISGENTNAVSVRIHRGLQQLKTHLGHA